jgi:hypothetical protein
MNKEVRVLLCIFHGLNNLVIRILVKSNQSVNVADYLLGSSTFLRAV